VGYDARMPHEHDVDLITVKGLGIWIDTGDELLPVLKDMALERVRDPNGRQIEVSYADGRKIRTSARYHELLTALTTSGEAVSLLLKADPPTEIPQV